MHTMDTSPCILWTPFHYECNMHTMDTSPYCGHLSIMNAMCMLWIPLHTVDTSSFFRHFHSLHKLWTPLHTKETYAQYGPSAYYRHLCIWTPLHNIDTSAYSRQLLLIVLLVHTTDTWVILVSVY